MNKTKKITNLHDYTKEVDRVIASGKPVHEQLIDLLEMVGGKVVDVSLNKHDKSVQDNQIKKTKKSPQNDTSDCCGADVLTVSGYPKDEGTHYWQCSKCGEPCNIKMTTEKIIEEIIKDLSLKEINKEILINQLEMLVLQAKIEALENLKF